MFGCEMGSKVDDVEAGPRGKLEREIERFNGHSARMTST
jgi:hypothetical protein